MKLLHPLKMASFELQSPRQRMRFFNVTDYPSMSTIASAVQGQPGIPLSLSQHVAREQQNSAIARGDYNQIEKNKFFSLSEKPVDTEASMRKLEQGQLFVSLGPLYRTRQYPIPRVFGGEIPLPVGQNVPDPQAYNPMAGKNPGTY
jgi:hypothetical protein